MHRWTVLLLVILVPTAPIFAVTYTVRPDGSGDFPTIQAAIDAATDGDIVELTEGIFTGNGNRDIDYLGKAIIVRSESGDPEACVIDCEASAEAPRRGFHFHNGETTQSILEGVTVRNGYGPQEWPESSGGAIRCRDSSPTIRTCVFSENTAYWGGALFLSGSEPAFHDCVFENNAAGYYAGAIHCYNNSPALFVGCQIIGNTAADRGGGMICEQSSPTLVDCTFFGNSAVWESGAMECRNSGALLRGCSLVGNSSPTDACFHSSGSPLPVLENTIIAFNEGSAVWEHGEPYLACCDLFANTGGDWEGLIADQYGLDGNISEDPLLCDIQNGDLTIRDDSPCLPFTAPNPECDLIGAWSVGCYWDSIPPDPVTDLLVASTTSTRAELTWTAPGDNGMEGTADRYDLRYSTSPISDQTWPEATHVLGEPTPSPSGSQETCVVTDLDPSTTYYFALKTADEIPNWSDLSNVAEGITEDPPILVQPDGQGTYATIQEAIAASSDGDVVELTNGTFTGDGNRDIDFLGKAITVRAQSGDPDSCVIDCQGCEEDPHRGFLFQAGEGPESVLQGITITNGYAASGPPPQHSGGAILCWEAADPTILDCVLLGNTAAHAGGGIYCGEDSPSPTITGCLLEDNIAYGCGGGIYCTGASSTITHCRIVGNISPQGAGICSERSQLVVSNCWVGENLAHSRGGGYHGHLCNDTIDRCTFDENYVTGRGGGLYFYSGSYSLSRSTLTENLATENGGGIMVHDDTDLDIENSMVVFSVDGGGIRMEFFCTVDLSCCNIYGNAGGDWVGPIADQEGINGNFSADPCFCDIQLDDYHLWNHSPCNQQGCGLIGAWPVGCWEPQDVEHAATLPQRPYLAMSPATPNPFVHSTALTYSLPATPEGSAVRLMVCDATGRLVRWLTVPGPSPGICRVIWDGLDLYGKPVGAGVYFVRLDSGGQQVTRRVVVVR